MSEDRLQNTPADVQAFQKHLNSRLNIQSALCYGSYAMGLQDEHSDIDLLIFTERLPTAPQLEEVYRAFPLLKKLELKNFDHWDTTWSLMNATLETQGGLKIDVGFNTTAWASRLVEKLIEKNDLDCEELPFRPYTFLGLLEHSQCLQDKQGFIQKMKSTLRPFPTALKSEIVKANLPMLIDTHSDLIETVKRNIGILAYQFQIFMGLDAMIQLLWVINDVYDPSSKRTEFYISKLKKLPAGFMDFINTALPKCYSHQKEFVDAFGKMKHWIEEEISDMNFLSILDPKSL